jgi:cobalt-zinc-cadmium efflux system protein
VVGVVLVVEVVAGLLTGSLALLSDAGHMATDVLGLGMALAAVHLADRAGTRGGRSFGLYRLEILAALANAVLLLGIAAYVVDEAVDRLGAAPELEPAPVLAAAAVGLAANVVAFLLLREGAEESLNVRGAYLEVVADLAGSVAVIVSTVGIALTGWYVLDALTGAAIGLWILPRTIRLGGAAVRILVQAAPQRIDLDLLTDDLRRLPAVIGVHDVHVWTLTSEMDVATAHLVVADAADAHGVLDRARELLEERWGIPHATLQVEPADHTGCDELSW